MTSTPTEHQNQAPISIDLPHLHLILDHLSSLLSIQGQLSDILDIALCHSSDLEKSITKLKDYIKTHLPKEPNQ